MRKVLAGAATGMTLAAGLLYPANRDSLRASSETPAPSPSVTRALGSTATSHNALPSAAPTVTYPHASPTTNCLPNAGENQWSDEAVRTSALYLRRSIMPLLENHALGLQLRIPKSSSNSCVKPGDPEPAMIIVLPASNPNCGLQITVMRNHNPNPADARILPGAFGKIESLLDPDLFDPDGKEVGLGHTEDPKAGTHYYFPANRPDDGIAKIAGLAENMCTEAVYHYGIMKRPEVPVPNLSD